MTESENLKLAREALEKSKAEGREIDRLLARSRRLAEEAEILRRARDIIRARAAGRARP